MYSDEEDDFFESDEELAYQSEGEDAFMGDEYVQSSASVLYKSLRPDAVLNKQEAVISEVRDLLGVSSGVAGSLLRHFKWNFTKLQESWFEDEAAVRNMVGVSAPCSQAPVGNGSFCCPICFEDVQFSEGISLACGHPFCFTCWRGFLQNAISEGSSCVNVACPMDRCNEKVLPDVVEMVVDDSAKIKYRQFLSRSYVEDNPSLQWCPGPNCDCAMMFNQGGAYDVVCEKCDTGWCWDCGEEAHRPLDCGTVKRWIVKNGAESENVTWILAHTKPCPKCKTPIEKNQGCLHMTCRKCAHHFCWLCLGPWKDHGSQSGGYYACNSFEEAKKTGKYSKEDEVRELAKASIEKYTHYYERYANHEKARKIAKEKQMPQIEEHIKRLEELVPISELSFMPDALNQVVECRRALKWTYAYGYYLVEDNKFQEKKVFFEFLQGQLEDSLERLHEAVEKPLEPLFEKLVNNDKMEWQEYRSTLLNLTAITRTYFQNLVKEFEKWTNQMATLSENSSTSDEASGSRDATNSVSRLGLGKRGR